MHDIEQHIIEHDLEIYLRACFQELQEKFQGRGIEWKWTERQLQMLVKRAGKLFIFAVMVHKYMSDSGLADPVAELEAILSTGAIPNSSSAYADLDAHLFPTTSYRHSSCASR